MIINVVSIIWINTFILIAQRFECNWLLVAFAGMQSCKTQAFLPQYCTQFIVKLQKNCNVRKSHMCACEETDIRPYPFFVPSFSHSANWTVFVYITNGIKKKLQKCEKKFATNLNLIIFVIFVWVTNSIFFLFFVHFDFLLNWNEKS